MTSEHTVAVFRKLIAVLLHLRFGGFPIIQPHFIVIHRVYEKCNN